MVIWKHGRFFASSHLDRKSLPSSLFYSLALADILITSRLTFPMFWNEDLRTICTKV